MRCRGGFMILIEGQRDVTVASQLSVWPPNIRIGILIGDNFLSGIETENF